MKIRENRFRINSEMKKILFHWYIYIALSMIDTKNLQLRSYHDIKSIDMKLKHYLAFFIISPHSSLSGNKWKFQTI